MRPPVAILLLITTFFLANASLFAQEASINWLDKKVPDNFTGTTFGVPWQKGSVQAHQTFSLTGDGEKTLPVQTWPLAYWPDGSVKWTAVALAPGEGLSANLRLTAGGELTYSHQLILQDNDSLITINTGTIQAVLHKQGSNLIQSILKNGVALAKNAHLVVLQQNSPEISAETPVVTMPFTGDIRNIEVEQSGPVRAVIKVEGTHLADNNDTLLPFVIRLYFYAGSDNIRLMHTIVYDGDEEKDFISGIGLRFEVPMHDAELYDRHIRFSAENGGLFAESVKGLTGLRRDPGQAIIKAQLNGQKVPPLEAFPERVKKGLPYIPTFGDYTLLQASPQAFQIRKRTQAGHSWLNSAQGERSNGVGYAGTPSGGMAFGIRNFWQSYPAQLDIRKAATEQAEVTLWLWAPDAPAMDLRFYHDGMGMDSYEAQWEGLEITYEDYEPGFGRPIGVARTSELNLWAVGATPDREQLIAYAKAVAQPAVLMADMDHIQNSGVFGSLWTVQQAQEPHPVKAQINQRLNWLFDYYQQQVKQHNWYGFWDFGDVMHTYDPDRHVWRYDVGGYAWDNSELATDLWLWYYFLHSGRADAFRMAEAMTRHTGEVDVHHIGPFAPLGSRHNVLHWGCSAKQLRISTVANRRFYYYLTADERIGDLMDEQLEAHKSLHDVPPMRKRAKIDISDSTMVALSFGTDWGSIASAWLTDWERTGNEKSYQRLINSMQTIAQQPQGFFTGSGRMNTESGAFDLSPSQDISVSHLNAVFGLVEICSELIDLIDMPAFESAWLRYCTFYNASPNQQKKELGSISKSRGLPQGHSRLTAYAAMKNNSEKLAQRAWDEFTQKDPQRSLSLPQTNEVMGPYTLNPITEAPFISTNYSAQWGLAAMQIMRFLEHMPEAY